MIRVNQATFRYKDSLPAALNRISFTVDPGDFIAVLGPNGSGKSTLARLLNGILIPDEGTITVLGMDTRDVSLRPDIRRAVGLVFSNPENQMVASTVEEDVAFGPENQGLPREKIRQRVDAALARVGMLELSHRPLHLLSGGQKQKTAIAGILAMKPHYIVLDEPTSMLDAQGRKDVIQTLLELNRRENIGIVLITHLVEEAVWARRILVLSQGTVKMEGSPEEVLLKTIELNKLGLESPLITRLVAELNRRGFTIPPATFQVDDLVRILCRSI
ncbi:MAG: energy-coupling factor transporter ATPase [Syntrophomonadaceae bacterium]|jgi:energy-coupling factor transport system ATP-binding protein|nr:energy-coupling factor transporter ATPase [Syntrophomonadaceae bacterium]